MSIISQDNTNEVAVLQRFRINLKIEHKSP